MTSRERERGGEKERRERERQAAVVFSGLSLNKDNGARIRISELLIKGTSKAHNGTNLLQLFLFLPHAKSRVEPSLATLKKLELVLGKGD